MDIEVIKSFTRTGGAVGSSCLIIYFIVENLFKEPIYQFLGSEKVFILLLAILGIIVTAIILSKGSKPDNSASSNAPTVNYKDSSTHNGDNRF